MKRVILMCIVGLLLTGCSKGVSQETFNKLNNDYEEIQKEYQEIKALYDELYLENEDNKNSFKDYFDKYTGLYAEKKKGSLVEAWGETTFLNCESSMVGDKNIQFIVPINSNEEEILSEYNNLLNSLTSLALANSINEISSVFIKYVDSQGIPIMEISLLNENDDNSANFMVSIDYMDTVLNTLSTTLD